MITRQFTTAIKGAASAVSVSIGFKPRFVRVVNYDTAGSLEWQAGMPAASGVKVVTAGAQTVVTSNGITVSDEGQITRYRCDKCGSCRYHYVQRNKRGIQNCRSICRKFRSRQDDLWYRDSGGL